MEKVCQDQKEEIKGDLAAKCTKGREEREYFKYLKPLESLVAK